MTTSPGVGGKIGRFQIEAEIGHGGMGVVYRALDPTLGRRVAIKLIAPHLAEDEQALARFRREAAAAAGLRHPGIATVYEFGEHEGAPFIVFEWIEGRTLKAVLAEEGPLPLERILAIFDQLSLALGHAHSRGVVHRDIKPANVIVSPDGRATIVDFGLAWLASAPGLTTVGTFFGTPAYMSPEQIQGLTLDGRSDLYSLAILLYEMLAGRPPFDAPSTPALIHEQVYVSPPPIARFRRDLPPPIGRALKRALSKEAGRRFPTAEEFAQALHGQAANPPQQAQGRLRLPGLLQKKPWIGAGLLAVLSVAVLAVALIPRVSPEPAPSPTPEISTPAGAATEQSPPPEPPTPLEGGLWPSPAGDAAQTGFVAEGFAAMDPTPRWFHEENGPHTGPVVGGGIATYGVYTAGSGALQALDWATGELAWEIPMSSEILSSPMIHPRLGLVYATTDGGELIAFDLEGTWQWMQSPEALRGVVWEGVTVAPDGSLYAATDQGWLRSFEPASGEPNGSVDLSASDVFVRRPAVIGSFVLATGAGGSLQALDRASLQSAWTAWLPSHATTPPLVLEDEGLLFVGEQDGTVQAFTLATGREIWTWQDGAGVTGLASDGRHVYAALGSEQVVALDPRSGDEAWRAGVGGTPSAAPLTDGRLVLVATDAGEIRYLLAETGEEVGEMRLTLGEPVLGAPAPAGGWLFVSTASGVAAFGPPAQ